MTGESTSPASPPARVSAVVAARNAEGRPIVGVVGKRTYQVVRGELEQAPAQIPLVEEAIANDDSSVMLHDSDLILNRTMVDVVVQGHAYAHEGRNWFQAAVAAGQFRRSLLVFGDRRCELQGGSLRFTPPDPVTKIPLAWESAYGGVDEITRRCWGDTYESLLKESGMDADPRFGPFGYPRNPVGKGYLLDPTPEAVAHCRLPNLEDPEHALRPQTLARRDFMRWPDGPKVASLGWLSYSYFPRSAQAGLPPAIYDPRSLLPESFFEVREGAVRPATVAETTTMPDRRDVRMCQSSAIGMRAEAMPERQKVELLNLHPRERLWSFSLGRGKPQFGLRLPGKKAEELNARLATMFIEPDLDRVVLVWIAEQAFDVPLPPEVLAQTQHVVLWRD